jgi:hypothetical protein
LIPSFLSAIDFDPHILTDKPLTTQFDAIHFASSALSIWSAVERGLESNPPTPDVRSTARYLISLLEDRPEDYVAIIEG